MPCCRWYGHSCPSITWQSTYWYASERVKCLIKRILIYYTYLTMKKISPFLPAVLIAVAIVILGFCLRSGFYALAFNDREVEVKGLAEKQVKANEASWSMTYTITGNELVGMYDQTKAINSKIVDFLKKSDIPEGDITLGTPSVYDASADRYGNNNVAYHYALTVRVSVSTSKVDAVYAMCQNQGSLLSQGVPFTDTYVSYDYSDLNSIKPAMIAEATKNAREAADRFAADSHSSVGKIKTATQGQFSIDDINTGKPYMKTVRVVSRVVYYLED